MSFTKSKRNPFSLESEVIAISKTLLPSWDKADAIRDDDGAIDEAGRIVLHHLTQNRLAETWVFKERFQQILSGCNGRIVDGVRYFFDHVLGNPTFATAVVQAEWSKLMEELRHAHSLKSSLEVVHSVTDRIEDSGAPRWAERLRKEAIAPPSMTCRQTGGKAGGSNVFPHTLLRLMGGMNSRNLQGSVRKRKPIWPRPIRKSLAGAHGCSYLTTLLQMFGRHYRLILLP
jgi:hypothetical protein